MFTTVFASVIRCVAIPIVAFILLKQMLNNDQYAFLIVTIALTVTNILSIIWSGFRIIPNLMLLRGGRIIRIFVKISLEVVSIVAFWGYYVINFNK